MRKFRSMLVLGMLAAAGAQVSCLAAPVIGADDHAAAQGTAAGKSAAPPRLTVGVSDPNTRLILPWFLADTIDAVNSRSSLNETLHKFKRDL
ncbi:hypothetical protein [Burkholderia gladioli]|uniref:hypothetical protein n=1 Tax=Burkholderia gladioli TaxID=28095 RepID=UPI0011B26307|nr:hypothetical protein [Burkholderia gladioli]MBU9268963.1 hypothetical protein [Burkholderia gladioli]MBU9641324.1 hypothetical protein [Burkholderia gladioli]MDJ1164456.1 hypothetical protein [Burkholderia gladioli pv. gladioli]